MQAVGNGIGIPFGHPPKGVFPFSGLGVIPPTYAWGYLRYKESATSPMTGQRDSNNDQKVILWNKCTTRYDDDESGTIYTMSTDEMDKREFYETNGGPCGQGTDFAGAGVSMLLRQLNEQMGTGKHLIQTTPSSMFKVTDANLLGDQSCYKNFVGTDFMRQSGLIDAWDQFEMFCIQKPDQTASGITLVGCSTLADAWRIRHDLFMVKEDAGSRIDYPKLAEKHVCHVGWKSGEYVFFDRYNETNKLTEQTTNTTSIPTGTVNGDLILGRHAASTWPLGVSDTIPPIILLGAWPTEQRRLIANWYLNRFRFSFQIPNP